MDDQEFHTAALVFAHYIGIDLDAEPELIRYAEDALEDLPPDWELGIGEGDNKGIPYYFNTKTDKSIWVHPLESKYRRIVEDERRKMNQRKQSRNTSSSGRDTDKDDRDKGQTRSSRRPQEDLTEILDFDDDESVPELEKPAKVDKLSTKHKKDADVTERPKFGMAADDFFDEEPDEPRDYSRLGSRSDSVKVQEGADKLSPTLKTSAGGGGDGGADKPSFKPIFSKNWLDDDAAKADKNKSSGEKTKSDRFADSSVRDRDQESPRPRSRGGGDDSVTSGGGLEKGVSFADSKSKGGVGDTDKSNSHSSSRVSSYDRDRNRDRTYNRDDDKNRGDSRDRDRHGDTYRRSDSRDDTDRNRGRSRDKPLGSSDRDRHQSSSPSSSRYYEEENRRLKAEVAALTDELEREKRKVLDITTEKEESHERLRRDISRIDSDLAAKVSEVRRLQEEVDSSDIRAKRQADNAVEDAHTKHREAIKQLKSELEEEWRGRLDTAKKRGEESIQDIRMEVDATKKRLEEAADDAEDMRRKVLNSREDGRGEASIVLEDVRAQLREAEDTLRMQSSELRRVKEDHANLSMKASGAMQSAQVSIAESEAVKAQATSAIAEAHSSQAALMLASQRLQQAEAESAKMRAENTMLKREVDSTSHELKKYQSQSFIANDGISAAEAEARRSKARLQAEINRLTTRNSELAGLNSALQNEVDLNEESKSQAVREVLQQLSKAEGEQHVSMLRLHDSDERNERTLASVAKADAELRVLKELVQKKERLIRDGIQQKDDLTLLLEDERSRAQVESDINRKEIKELRAKVAEGERAMRDMKEGMQSEMNKKVPEIAAAAAAEAEKLCNRESEYKLSAIRSDYEIKLEQKTRELLRATTNHEEAMSRLKVGHADDKAEGDRLRYQVRRLQRRCDELEADGEDNRRLVSLAASTPMNNNMHNNSVNSINNGHYAMAMHQRGGAPIYHQTPLQPYSQGHDQGVSESIDGTMFANTSVNGGMGGRVGVGGGHTYPSINTSFNQPPPPPHPAHSVDVSSGSMCNDNSVGGGFATIDEQRFVEMMQNEIKGIQQQLSRSTNSHINMGVTPTSDRWVTPHPYPHSHSYSAELGDHRGHNQTVSYGNTPAQQHQQHYAQYKDTSSVMEAGDTHHSRDDSRAWAELLAKQAKREHKQSIGTSPSPRAVGFAATPSNGSTHDENGKNNHRHSAAASDGGDLNRSGGKHASPRKSSRKSSLGNSYSGESKGTSTTNAPSYSVDRGRGGGEDLNSSDPDTNGYHSGYWKTKYMR